MSPFLLSSDIIKDRTAIITGGTAGIGKTIAVLFAQHGAKVVVFGQNKERGDEVLKELQNLSSNQHQFIPVDVSSTLETENAIKQVVGSHGGIDILINNAGITRDQLMMKMSEEEWDLVLAVNLKSCYNTCRAVVRSMLKARRGTIINMSSVVGLQGNPGQVNYAAAKAGMIGFTKSLALELATRSIRVNCICPGFIDTAMTGKLTEQQKEEILKQIPMGTMGKPIDIAKAALFLASDWSSYMTGQVLVVDGGMVR